MIILNNTFTTVHTKDAKQLLVKLFGSRLVIRTKRNSDESICFKVHLLIKSYKDTDSGETHSTDGKLTTFRYLISLVGRCGWNIINLDIVTTFLNRDDDDDYISIVLPKSMTECHEDTCRYAPTIMVRLRNARYSLKQEFCLWLNDMNIFLLFRVFTQWQADPNLYICSDGISNLLYVDDIFLIYAPTESSIKEGIEIQVKLSENLMIANVHPALKFIGIKIHSNIHSINLHQTPFITTILKWFPIQHAHAVSTLLDHMWILT